MSPLVHSASPSHPLNIAAHTLKFDNKIPIVSQKNDDRVVHATSTTGPSLFTRCYHLKKSGYYDGYRGWRCGKGVCFGDIRMRPGLQTNSPEEMGLTPHCDPRTKRHKSKGSVCHPLLDAPCAIAVEYVDANRSDIPAHGWDCVCPEKELQPERVTSVKYSGSVPASIDGFLINDIGDGINADNATSASEAAACAASARAILPDWVRRAIDLGDWAGILREGRSRGFVDTFVHTRSTWTVPYVKDRFDWVLSGDTVAAKHVAGRFAKGGPYGKYNFSGEPRTVFIPPAPSSLKDPKYKKKTTTAADDVPGGNQYSFDDALTSETSAYSITQKKDFRVLVVGGADHTATSVRTWLERVLLLRYFDRVLFEALDVPMPGVGVMPVGFTCEYTKKHGDARIFDALDAIEANGNIRQPGFIAAWGKRWKYLDKTIPSRFNLDAWLESTPLGNRSEISWERWWSTLVTRRFQLCPTGNGVQTPKVMESIIAGTVPVVEPNNAYAFTALRKLGYPIAVVDKWSDITAERLDQWWLDLGPKLAIARWMLLSDIWFAFVTQPCRATDIFQFLAGVGLPQAKEALNNRFTS